MSSLIQKSQFSTLELGSQWQHNSQKLLVLRGKTPILKKIGACGGMKGDFACGC
jgi:hypothetical protein